MKVMGLQGVVRGKKVVTTNPDVAQPCPDDRVNRAFVTGMPNQLWFSNFTYVSSWQGMASTIVVLTQMIAFPWFGLHATLAEKLQIGMLFTIVSIARSFVQRRAFEAIRVRSQQRAVPSAES